MDFVNSFVSKNSMKDFLKYARIFRIIFLFCYNRDVSITVLSEFLICFSYSVTLEFPTEKVWQTPEEGRKTYRPKRYGNNNKDNSPKALNDRNHQASSQKFRPLNYIHFRNTASVSVLKGMSPFTDYLMPKPFF